VRKRWKKMPCPHVGITVQMQHTPPDLFAHPPVLIRLIPLFRFLIRPQLLTRT
jgi:hypothetical protein